MSSWWQFEELPKGSPVNIVGHSVSSEISSSCPFSSWHRMADKMVRIKVLEARPYHLTQQQMGCLHFLSPCLTQREMRKSHSYSKETPKSPPALPPVSPNLEEPVMRRQDEKPVMRRQDEEVNFLFPSPPALLLQSLTAVPPVRLAHLRPFLPFVSSLIQQNIRCLLLFWKWGGSSPRFLILPLN